MCIRDRSKIFVELEETKVTLTVLSGEMVRFQMRGQGPSHWIAPGFYSWYSGMGLQGQKYEGPHVMNIDNYARKRAHFFTDHKLGFTNELRELATTIQGATKFAAHAHKNLMAKKIDLLQGKHEAGVRNRKRRIEYDKNLRRLFRRKTRYDE